jgi:WD40 repeat protein
MAQAPVVNETCDLCEQEIYEWKCIECEQFICKGCKRIHERSAATKKHHILSLKDVTSVSSYETTCKTHKSHQFQLYCKNCLVLVCKRCITSTHEGHTFCDVDKIADQKKRQLEDYFDDLRESLRKANDEAEKTQRENRKTLKTYDSVIKSLCDYVMKTIKEVEQCQEELVKSIQEEKTKASGEVKNYESKLQAKKSKICTLINETEIALKSNDNLRIVQCHSFLDGRMDTSPTKMESLEIVIPKFLPVHENFPVKPEVLLGIIEFETNKPRKRPPLKKKNSTLSVLSTDADAGPIAVTTIKHSFQIESLSDRCIGCIAVASDNEAWIACPYDQNITLVRRNGNVSKEIPTEFNISDIAISKTGALLATSSETNTLKIISSNGESISDFFHTGLSEPHGISVTRNGEILICLTDGDFGHVARVSEGGKLIQEYDTYIVRNQSFLLRRPVRCVETLNGDLCILDEAAKKIIVLDQNGMLRFLWDGPLIDSKRRHIEPSGLACDDRGNILVTDYDNNDIYIIDSERNVTEILQIVEKKYPLKEPYGIAIHADKFVWVGCEDGIVHVMRYRKDAQ